MADPTPTERAKRRTRDVEHARARIRRAWNHAPDPAVAATLNRTGPISGGDTSDPTLGATSARDHQRHTAVSELARITLALGETLTEKVDGQERPGSVDYLVRHIHQRRPGQPSSDRPNGLRQVLALHEQWWNELVGHVATLDTPTGFDDARALLINVNEHANAIVRLSRWIYGVLVRPPADPNARVCDHPDCQEALGDDDGDECDHHAARRERAEAKRAAEIAAELARPLCPDCSARLSEEDVEGGHERCLDCRTPKCGAEIRTDCGRDLTEDDIARNATNCQPCRNWQSWKNRQDDRVGASSSGDHPWEWQEPK